MKILKQKNIKAGNFSLNLDESEGPLQIRNFRIDDYEDVFKIWESRRLTLGLSDTKDEIQKMSRLNPELFLVAEEKGTLCGVVMGAFDGRRAYVHHLAVALDCKNRNLGKTLMKELESRFKAMGVIKAHLFVETRNDSVVDYYKDLGWHTRPEIIMMSKDIER